MCKKIIGEPGEMGRFRLTTGRMGNVTLSGSDNRARLRPIVRKGDTKKQPITIPCVRGELQLPNTGEALFIGLMKPTFENEQLLVSGIETNTNAFNFGASTQLLLRGKNVITFRWEHWLQGHKLLM